MKKSLIDLLRGLVAMALLAGLYVAFIVAFSQWLGK